MANKEAVFKMRVDTGNSVQDIQNFDQGLKNLNQDIQEVQQTAAQSGGINKFASKLDELDAQLNSGTLSFREMTKLMKQYQTVAIQAGAQSPIGNRAVQSAAQLRDELADLDQRVRLLSSDYVKLDTAVAGIQTGAAAFQGFQSVMALTGVESEKLVQTMVKLQATQGLVNSVQQIANALNKDSILGIQLRVGWQKLMNLITGESITIQEDLSVSSAITTAALEREAAAIEGVGESTLVSEAEIEAFAGSQQDLSINAAVTTATIEREAAAIEGVGESTVISKSETDAFSESQKKLSTASGVAQKGLKLLRATLVTLGIGAIVVGIGYLIANFDKLKDLLGGVSKGQKALNDTMDDYKKGAQDAITSTQKVGTAFDLAKKGVVSKEEALQTYNETLGDAFGKATTLAEAEELYNKKAEAYVEAMAKRAQANALFQKSAEETAKALTASQEDQRTTTDNLVTGALSAFGLFASAAETNVKQQKSRTEEVKKTAQENAKIYEDEAKKLLTSAEQTEKANGIKSESEQKLEDQKKAAAEKAAADAKKRREEEYKAEQDRLKNLKALYNEYLASIEAAETEYFDSLLTDQQREEQAVTDKFFNLIEQSKQYGDDTSILETAQAAALATIRKKFDEERLAKLAETEEKRLALLRSYQSIVLTEAENELIAFEDVQKEQSKALSEALNEGVITEEQFMQAQLKLEEAYAKKYIELNEAKNEAIKESNAKRWEEETKNIEKMLGFAQMGLDQLGAINDLLNQLGENRLNKIAEQQDAELASLDQKQQAALSNESLTADQRTKIEQDFAQQKYQVQLKAFNEEEKIKKAQFARDKALRIAQAAIDTAGAVITSIKNGGGIPTGLPFGIAAAALGATQIATIAAQKYQGGTAPSPPSLSGGGVTGAGASSFQASDNLSTEQTDLSTIGQQAPVSQVVVLESDITGTQNKVAMQEKLSTY